MLRTLPEAKRHVVGWASEKGASNLCKQNSRFSHFRNCSAAPHEQWHAEDEFSVASFFRKQNKS